MVNDLNEHIGEALRSLDLARRLAVTPDGQERLMMMQDIVELMSQDVERHEERGRRLAT